MTKLAVAIIRVRGMVDTARSMEPAVSVVCSIRVMRGALQSAPRLQLSLDLFVVGIAELIILVIQFVGSVHVGGVFELVRLHGLVVIAMPWLHHTRH